MPQQRVPPISPPEWLLIPAVPPRAYRCRSALQRSNKIYGAFVLPHDGATGLRVTLSQHLRDCYLGGKIRSSFLCVRIYLRISEPAVVGLRAIGPMVVGVIEAAYERSAGIPRSRWLGTLAAGCKMLGPIPVSICVRACVSIVARVARLVGDVQEVSVG